jgi:hypothetical protein
MGALALKHKETSSSRSKLEPGTETAGSCQFGRTQAGLSAGLPVSQHLSDLHRPGPTRPYEILTCSIRSSLPKFRGETLEPVDQAGVGMWAHCDEVFARPGVQ